MKLKSILLAIFLTSLTGCSVQKMAGEGVIEFTHDQAIPYLMAQGDLEAACSMGESMGPVVSSFTKVGLDPSNIGVATNMAAGMCAEFVQRESELDRVRALYENRTNAAQDAMIREKQGHRTAAMRMIRGYDDAMKTFGDFSTECREFDNKTDELLALLGLASGALAILHDFNSEKSVGISLDVPGIIEKSAKCFDDKEWWGMPSALRASIWLSIPGAGPEGVDPIETLQKSAQMGDEQGVQLARAMLVMMANTIGQNDVMCKAIAELPPAETFNHDYDMLNAYAVGMITHQADVAWTKEKGYRAPFMQPACPGPSETASTLNAAEVDDLLEGMFDDENSSETAETSEVPATDKSSAAE